MLNVFRKRKYTHLIVIAMLIIAVAIPLYVYAEANYRLKAILDEEHVYFSVSVSTLNYDNTTDYDSFKEQFDGRYVVVSGAVSEKNDNKKFELKNFEDRYCTVDTSENGMKSIAESLSVGDEVLVYGNVSCKNNSYTIIADHIVIDPKIKIGEGRYAFFDGESYKGVSVNDLTKDGHITYFIPSTWNDDYVCTPLTNNGITGSQYFLNAIYPQNTSYPEIFYIFYFTNETYLDSAPKDPNKVNYHAIEKQIIENILQDFTINSSIDVDRVTDVNGTKYDSYQTSFKASDGNDYKLEFVFRTDGKDGIVCMLYLYYPNDEAINHIYDVAFLIESLKID